MNEQLVSVNTNPVEDYKYDGVPTTRTVGWDAAGLRVTRLRVVSDRGFPYWDISYCYGVINGEHVRVSLPFWQIPKPYAPEAETNGYGRGFIVGVARDAGVYAKGLGILDQGVLSATQA
jgi:hypothetical protein